MNLIDIEPYKDGKIVYNDEDHGIKIKDLPVVDAVEVVRCKDCILAKSADNTMLIGKAVVCRLYSSNPIMRVDDFCSYGERKDTTCDACDLTRWTDE